MLNKDSIKTLVANSLYSFHDEILKDEFATKKYVDSKSLPILLLDDSNRTGDKLFPLLPEHNLVFIAGDAQFTDKSGNINTIYGLCYSDLQSDGSKLLTEYRTSKSALISANGTLKSFDYIDKYTKTILTLFKNAPSGKVLVKNQNNTFEWIELLTTSDLSSYAPITSPVFKKSIRIGDIDPTKTLGENSIIASSYGEATGIYTLSNGKASAARGNYSHAEGYACISKGLYSHAEGEQTGTNAQSSHAEGQGGTANGVGSHAEGYYSTSNGKYSHAEGYNTIATGDNQHVQGKYNIEDKTNKYAHIVGNGYRDELNYKDYRSNAYTLDWKGNAWYAGKLSQEGMPTDNKDLTNKKYVDDKVAGIVNSAPETLDTLQELAAALGNDPNFATTVATQIGKKVDKVDSMSLTHNDLTNELKANYDAAYNYSQAKHSYNDLTDKPTIPSIAGLATESYVDTKINDRMNNLKIKTITQSDYGSLSNKDPNTLYLITD